MARIRDYAAFSEMIAGYRHMILLDAALRLDLATRIERGVNTAPALARACRVDRRALEITLDALCAIGLLRKSRDARYHNGPAARRFLVAGSPWELRAKLGHSIASALNWATLPEVLRSGGALPARAKSLEDPACTEQFIRAMDQNARETAAPLARACPLGGARSLIDIGGGPGAFALEYLRLNPGLNVTIFDLPQTLRVTRKILRERGVAPGAVRLAEGDYFRDALGGPYEAALLSHILHSLSETQCADLLRKAWEALAPGGRVIVHDFLLDPDRAGPEYAALFSVHMLVNTEGGRAYSGEEIRALLREAGFREVKIHRGVSPTTGAVTARKPAPRGAKRARG